MKKLFFGIALSLLVTSIKAQFNGSIEFKYFTQKDTTNNVYLVKNKTVKLDQYGRKSGAVEGSFIFDLGANTIKFVNPKRKVWGEHKSETAPMIKGTCEVAKGTGVKTIQGVKCNEYIVKNTEENTQITYWITAGKYDFFMPLLKLWNRKDKQSIYFNQIKDLAVGSMPLMSEEKQISDNKVITRLEVVKINKAPVEDAKLAIPADYKRFEP
jgi:hypothetical protein